MKEDTLTVYWSTTASTSKESWSQLYNSPRNVFNHYRSARNPESGDTSFFACPAMTGLFENVFQFTSAIDDEVFLPNTMENRNFDHAHFFQHFDGTSNYFNIPESKSKVTAQNYRNSSIEGYMNATYNLSWIFFTDEPVIARMTAPYFPPKTPAEGVILAAGEFDIGSWFRPYNLDYHIPNGTKSLVFKEDDPLFYLEIKTDKKVVFKRFKMNDQLQNLSDECSQSPKRYSRFKKLSDRYKKSRESMIPELVLSEIKNNIIE